MTTRLRKQARKPRPFLQKILPFILVFALAGVLHAESSTSTGPEILDSARDVIRSQNLTVTGRLRTGGQRVPFRLVEKSGVISYQFSDPSETVTVKIGKNGSELSGVKDPLAKVRDSLITYDDLTLRFLFWNKVELLGTEKVGPLPCWKLRLVAPTRQSPYAIVHLWVNQQSGAFLRAIGYDWEGNKIKEFKVVSTQQIDGRYFLKQMRIQNLRPNKTDKETITYLEIDKS